MDTGGRIHTDYDARGATYSTTRVPDPRLAACVRAALGDAASVVNVGSGTGAYEPPDLDVLAIEPSAAMIAARPSDSATARRDYPFLVALDAAELGKPAWVHCETVNTIPVALLGKRLAVLTAAAMLRVDEALRHSLALA